MIILFKRVLCLNLFEGIFLIWNWFCDWFRDSKLWSVNFLDFALVVKLNLVNAGLV